MPFGLSNAEATYQRLMALCLSGLPADRILAYLDDIVVFSRTFKEHLLDLENVLKRLLGANISLRADKCMLGSNNVDFLGYHIS